VRFANDLPVNLPLLMRACVLAGASKVHISSDTSELAKEAKQATEQGTCLEKEVSTLKDQVALLQQANAALKEEVDAAAIKLHMQDRESSTVQMEAMKKQMQGEKEAFDRGYQQAMTTTNHLFAMLGKGPGQMPGASVPPPDRMQM
jgi:predicted RNase H-like nuclease (RuvC/YqgF family)